MNVSSGCQQRFWNGHMWVTCGDFELHEDGPRNIMLCGLCSPDGLPFVPPGAMAGADAPPELTAGEQLGEAPREFRIAAVRRSNVPKGACVFCRRDRVRCAECERRGMVPNAFPLAYRLQHITHIGQCFRHGEISEACGNQDPRDRYQVVNTQSRAHVSRARLYAICTAFAGLALVVGFILGMIVGPAWLYVLRLGH